MICRNHIKTIFTVLLSTTICTITINNLPYEDIMKNVMNNSIVEHFFREEACACMEQCLAGSEDKWFIERFRRDIPPLLSLCNSTLPDHIYTWWQSLQTKSKTNYSTVIQELFTVVPGEGHYTDAGPDRCRTCAVVGNSGNLLGTKYGKLIDNHDFVFRMNKAPIKGYEKDVGSRTTHRIMYPESATHLDNSTHLLLVPFKTLDLQWLISALTNGTIKRTRMKVIDKIQTDKNKVMVMHPAFMHYVHNTWLQIKARRAYPSTGILVLMFALHICDQVSVFGFGADRKGNWYHYFEKLPRFFRHSGLHRGGIEQEIIKELQKRKLIDLYKGWNI